MREMLSEEKKAEAEKLTFSTDTIRKYFPAPTRPNGCRRPSSSCWRHGRKSANAAKIANYIRQVTGRTLRSGFLMPKIRRSLCLSAHFAIDQSTLPATFAQNTSRNRVYASCLSLVGIERIEAGVVGYQEAVMATIPRSSRLLAPRLRALVASFPGSLWKDGTHKERMEYAKTRLHYYRRRDTPAFTPRLFLLTSSGRAVET
ncbi:MAG: hypothetical protein ACLRX2_12285 [Oscillospiraceae bacterium]